jgi:hypothetical protein
MMSEPTPGPWRFDEYVGDDYDGGLENATILCNEEDEDGDPKQVLWACSCCQGVNISNAADGLLILAAPDLLEAAEAVLGCIGSSETARPKKEALRAAIAKARGTDE